MRYRFSSASGTRRRHTENRGWLAPLLLFLGVLTVYSCTSARDIMHIDAHAATVEAWHIAATGSPWLEGELSPDMENQFIGEAPNGHIVALRMAGPVIAGVPAYLLLNSDPDPNAFIYEPGGFAAALLTAGTVLFLFLAFRDRLGQVPALTAACIFGFATPTWLISADQLWTHTITQFGLSGAAWSGSKDRWWAAGIFLGIGMLGRPHLALIAAAIGLGVGVSRREWLPVLAVAVPTTASLAVLAVWNRWMFGEVSITGSYGGKMEAAFAGYSNPESGSRSSQVLNLAGFLFSPDRGLLIWTPMLLILVPAMFQAWRFLPDWSKWLSIGGVIYTIVQLRMNVFHGGDAFWGYRLGLELVTCLAPALALSLRHIHVRYWVPLWLLIALQFCAVAAGAAIDGYYILMVDVWTDNSFWLLLRENAGVIGGWLAMSLAIGVGIGLRTRRTSMASEVRGSLSVPT